MNLFPYILGPVWVLDVTLTSDGHTIAAWRCKMGGEPQQTVYDAAAVAKGVAVVTFSGLGTFVKPADSLLAAAGELLAGLGWRQLLRPTAEGSSLAQAVVRRAALPVLGLFLCLLAANAAVAPSLNTRRQTLQKELSARERTASTAADATDRQRTLLAEFSARPAASRAVVCDRIAEAVPAQVVLTRLAVEPLTKRFEAGKPLQRQERTAVVAGTAPAADDVSTFVERLAGAACCRTVRLTNVERERDAERLVFRIEIGL